MSDAMRTTSSGPVLVSDFDGTMTRHDFYKLVIEKLIPPDTPDYWNEYRSGSITHFEALRRYFATIRASRDDVLATVRQMEIDPQLSTAIANLQERGWRVIVTSAGCEWYIRQLLAAAGVDIVVYANPGRFEEGQGLLMEMPVGSPYVSDFLGIDKTAVVRDCVAQGGRVAFAGDGFPDADAARLVPPGLRFARSDLADVLGQEGLGFRRFDRWSEIPRVLLDSGD
jgi:2,3-diketo-5-methylthio-1-phosphopentane phosphatase